MIIPGSESRFASPGHRKKKPCLWSLWYCRGWTGFHTVIMVVCLLVAICLTLKIQYQQVLLVAGGEDGFFTYLDSTEILRWLVWPRCSLIFFSDWSKIFPKIYKIKSATTTFWLTDDINVWQLSRRFPVERGWRFAVAKVISQTLFYV